jgi:hypothetical protein
MQAVAVPAKSRGGRVRTAFGALLGLAGVGLLGLGLFADAGMPAVVGGGLALLLGAALLARYVVRPLVGALGWPVSRLGIRGTLAQENAVRNPQRTASTASALMIGLGLVTFALIFGASLRESFERAIDDQFASDLQIRSETFGPMPNAVPDEIERLPQVASVTDMRLGQVGVDDRVVSAAAVEPAKLAAAWNLDVVDGSLDRFGDGGVVVSNDAAEQIGVSAGDTLDVTFPQTGVQPLTVQAIVDNETSSYYLDEDTFLDNATDEGPLALYVSLANGVTVADARPAVEGVTSGYPALEVQDAEDLRRDVRDQVNQALGLMSALAGAVDPDRPGRHRQHAEPVGVRAGPRVRTAPRRRCDTQPGARDRALGVRAHRGARCALRDRCGHDLRLDERARARRGRLQHVRLPSRPGRVGRRGSSRGGDARRPAAGSSCRTRGRDPRGGGGLTASASPPPRTASQPGEPSRRMASSCSPGMPLHATWGARSRYTVTWLP